MGAAASAPAAPESALALAGKEEVVRQPPTPPTPVARALAALAAGGRTVRRAVRQWILACVSPQTRGKRAESPKGSPSPSPTVPRGGGLAASPAAATFMTGHESRRRASPPGTPQPPATMAARTSCSISLDGRISWSGRGLTAPPTITSPENSRPSSTSGRSASSEMDTSATLSSEPPLSVAVESPTSARPWSTRSRARVAACCAAETERWKGTCNLNSTERPAGPSLRARSDVTPSASSSPPSARRSISRSVCSSTAPVSVSSATFSTPISMPTRVTMPATMSPAAGSRTGIPTAPPISPTPATTDDSASVRWCHALARRVDERTSLPTRIVSRYSTSLATTPVPAAAAASHCSRVSPPAAPDTAVSPTVSHPSQTSASAGKYGVRSGGRQLREWAPTLTPAATIIAEHPSAPSASNFPEP
mmetsp:Transcript_9417/g.26103  ORF Transcript_9417/g.26103 Transcript_9417/m.26103 type:complete len:422 (-) Transcript_9417:399-1664(-)